MDVTASNKSLSENQKWVCFRAKGRMAPPSRRYGATRRREERAYPWWICERGAIPPWRDQMAFCAKTLRAARLLSVAGVGSLLTARFGDARNSPPWPRPKSAAAGPLFILIQALNPALRKRFFIAWHRFYGFAQGNANPLAKG